MPRRVSGFVTIFLLLTMSAVYCFPTKTCSGKPANIMFVLDSSSSIWIVDYEKQLDFVEKLVNTFDIGPDKTQVRIGAITFSNSAYLEFSLDQHTNRKTLSKAISNIPYRAGSTNTAIALALLRKELEPRIKDSTVPFIAIAITDGLSTDPKATRHEAKRLHDLGIVVYAIGVGANYHLEELNVIASDPTENVFQVSDYSALEDIAQTLNVKTCKDIEITTTTTTTTTPVPTTTTTTTTTTTSPAPTTITTTPAPTTSAPTTTTTTPAPTTSAPTTTTTTPAPTTSAPTTTTTTPAPTTSAPTTTTTTPAPTTSAPTTTTTTPAPTTSAPTTTTTTPAPTTSAPTTTTTTPAPTTTTTPSATTTTTPAPTMITSTTPAPTTTTSRPERPQRDATSSVSFGYDLLTMGAYRAHMISQFINSLLPYTGYGNFSVVSYSFCPESLNVPVTSLMNATAEESNHSVPTNNAIPDLSGVVYRMKKDLHSSAIRNFHNGLTGHQTAVLFIDPTVTIITPRLIRETNRLKKQGPKLFLINVGQVPWSQPHYLYTMSSQPYYNYMFSFPTYNHLLHRVRQAPFRFRALCNGYVPSYY